jgi:thiol-disulfide isomerase/thioredoxin
MSKGQVLFKLSPRKLDFVGLLGLVLAFVWLVSVTLFNERHLLLSQAEGDHLVVFTAQWCASCTTLVPRVQGLAARLSIPFTAIDVDDTKATSQARQFGLSIPRTDLPQAYYIQSGKQTLVLEGKQYNAGQAAQLEADVQKKVNDLR